MNYWRNLLKLFIYLINFQRPSALVKTVYNTDDKKKNNDLANVIKSGLNDLKNEIENVSKEEKEIEKPNEIVDIVEKIIEFNNRTQSGQGLNILAPEQMFSRLPIFLAQLRAGNNS